MINQDELARVMSDLDNVVMAIRAQGGYKYRERVKASDRELNAYVANAERNLRTLVVQNMVARQILEEWGKEHEFRVRLKQTLRELFGD